MSKWTIKIDTNPNYCGEGAGGAQFAHGQATITDARLADWFRSHKGYTVTKVEEPKAVKAEQPKDEQPKDEQPKTAKTTKASK